MKPCAVFLFVPTVQSPVGSERSPFPCGVTVRGQPAAGGRKYRTQGAFTDGLFCRPVFFTDFSGNIKPG